MFSERGEETFPREQSAHTQAGESIDRTLRMLQLLFSWQATILHQGAVMQDKKKLQSAWKRARGKTMRKQMFDLHVHDLWKYSVPILMTQTGQAGSVQ